MPSAIDKNHIVGSKYDRRSKLTLEQKKEIKENKLGLSQRKLAELYEVSRRTITFILDPDKLKANLERRKERGGSKQYYDKDKHTKCISDLRAYKKGLLNKGLID